MLGLSFAIVALLYAMVGFGGGTSYIALLVLFDTPFTMIPIVALLCNIIVVTGGLCHYIHAGIFSWKRLLPFISTSVPAAFIGGAIPIERELYLSFLGFILLFVGLLTLVKPPFALIQSVKTRLYWLPWLIGCLVGFVSGLVGMGGGIFLSPALLALGWSSPRHTAALASGFIFVNSLAGLAGQLTKQHDLAEAFSYWPALLAVFIGGQLGSFFSSQKLKEPLIKKLTAGLVLFVAFRLLLA